MKNKLAILSLSGALLLANYAHSSVVPNPQRREYNIWLNNIKLEMLNRGISNRTIEKAYQTTDFYHPKPEVVKIDRRQAEFVLTSAEYLNRMIQPSRIKKGRNNYRKLYPLFKDIQKKYGVQPEYLVAFWGAESNFGTDYGKFPVIASLTQLSYDYRRPDFFKEQLYQALKIIDQNSIDSEKMIGSWAGAMGHFQFIPSTFNTYAVDYNKDGQIDIWHSFEDAAASAANYLHQIGWNGNQPWGMEVSLPWNFDFSQSGKAHPKYIKEWTKEGIRTIDNKILPLNRKWKASILLPDGRKGRAYIVLDNFWLIKQWNKSDNYALAIGILSDYIRGTQKWKPVAKTPATRFKSDDITKIQAFINKLFGESLKEDGKLGEQTREKIQKIQSLAKLPADGYPDYNLLNKINNYNSEIGFSIPVPHRKLHKGR